MHAAQVDKGDLDQKMRWQASPRGTRRAGLRL